MKFSAGFLKANNLVPLTVAFQTSATSNAETITWPTVQAGDVAVLFDIAIDYDTGVAPSAVTPSGFTAIGTTGELGTRGYSGGGGEDPPFSRYTRLMTSHKVCSGSESGALTGMNTNTAGNVWKILLIFRPLRTPSVAVFDNDVNGFTPFNPNPQVCAAGSQAAPLIVFGVYAIDSLDAGTISPRTFSPAKDSEVSNNGDRMYFAWKIYNAAPADVTVDMDGEIGVWNWLHSFGLALTG